MTGDPLDRLRAADPLGGELPAPLERMPARDRAVAPERGRDIVLVAANLMLLATVLLHGLDHALIQDRSLTELSFEVMLGGFVITAVAALSLVASLRADRRAPLIALLAGPWVATLIVVGHFIPHWGEFSDPYADAGVDTISYVLAAATAGAGVAVGVVALMSALRRPSAR